MTATRDYIPDWAKLDHKETDFRFWDAVTLIERLNRSRKPDPSFIYQRNQAKYQRSRNFCTAVATMSAILTYWKLSRSDQERRDFRDYCVDEHGYKSTEWHRKSTWNEASVNYWNKIYLPKKGMEMLFFNTNWLSEEYWTGLSMYYDACIGYRGNASWNKDKEDWVLDQARHWEYTYWHIRRDRALDDKYIRAIDNYKWRTINGKEINNYKIPRNNLQLLRLLSWQTGYYPSATFFVPLHDVSDLPLEWTKPLLSRLTENSILREKAHNDVTLSEKNKKDIQTMLHNNSEEIRKQFQLS